MQTSYKNFHHFSRILLSISLLLACFPYDTYAIPTDLEEGPFSDSFFIEQRSSVTPQQINERVETEMKEYVSSSQDGKIEKRFKLACTLREGKETEDLAGAREEFRKLADDNNHPESQYNLAQMLLNGEGGDKDAEEAQKWFLKAASKEHINAQLALVEILQKAGKEDVAEGWRRHAALNPQATEQGSIENK